jgi:hypothetical protein
MGLSLVLHKSFYYRTESHIGASDIRPSLTKELPILDRVAHRSFRYLTESDIGASDIRPSLTYCRSFQY